MTINIFNRCSEFNLTVLLILLVTVYVAPVSGEFFPSPSVSMGEPFHKPPVNIWDYDINGDGKADYRKQDVNNDGVVDVYLHDRDFNGSFDDVINKSLIPEQEQRHLIVCVDSIPHFFMEKLWNEGHFRDFNPPSHMISTFPSDTNPAFTEILDTAKTPGVENRYYDRAQNRLVGGARDHIKRRYRRTDRTFHALFDYEQNPRYGALIYLTPYLVADHDLAKCRKAFWKLYRVKAPGEPIFLYIGSNDAIGHKTGKEGTLRQLFQLEQILDEIVYKTEGKVRISLFSDHGNNMVYSDRPIDLGRHLVNNGFRLNNRLKSERDVVVPRFGLVGDACIYTREGNKERLAEVLKPLKGVDFALYEKDGQIFVLGRNGKARITKNDKLYKYDIIEGDPLELRGIQAQLKRQRKIDENGFADDEAWFELTKGHRYPDILRRLVTAMMNHVVNRPDIYLSLEDGYCYGNGVFINMIDLLSTHGSAIDTSTNGIAMSTSRELPDYIRAVDLMDAFGEPKPRLPNQSAISAE